MRCRRKCYCPQRSRKGRPAPMDAIRRIVGLSARPPTAFPADRSEVLEHLDRWLGPFMYLSSQRQTPSRWYPGLGRRTRLVPSATSRSGLRHSMPSSLTAYPVFPNQPALVPHLEEPVRWVVPESFVERAGHGTLVAAQLVPSGAPAQDCARSSRRASPKTAAGPGKSSRRSFSGTTCQVAGGAGRLRPRVDHHH